MQAAVVTGCRQCLNVDFSCSIYESRYDANLASASILGCKDHTAIWSYPLVDQPEATSLQLTDKLSAVSCEVMDLYGESAGN